MKALYKILDFKFWEDNVVMPFKYKGEIFYYQIRFTGNSPIRYFFPPISAKPPYVIDHDVKPSGNKIIISEGVFDAIADLIMFPEYIPFAVLGSSISDYQNNTYLRITNFSDFQTNALTGEFGGEFRLAYYYDGTKEIPVTKGSFSGNIKDILSSLELSKEIRETISYQGPKWISFNK